MSVKILAHRIAVKPFDIDEWDEDRKRAKSLGFALPEMENSQRAKASVDVGTVVYVGPTAEVETAVGDVIAYVKNAGKFVVNPFTQEEVYVLNDEDVLAVLNKE